MRRFFLIPLACLVAMLAVFSVQPQPASADEFATNWRQPNDSGGFDYHSGLYDVTTDEVIFDDGVYYATYAA